MGTPQQYSLNLGLDSQPLATSGEALPDLTRLYNAVRLLAYALDNYTQVVSSPQEDWENLWVNNNLMRNHSKVYLKTAVALTAGQLVCFGGTDADGHAMVTVSTGLVPFGFVRQSYAANEYAEVFLQGINDKVSGLTAGTKYFYSGSVAGGVATTGGATVGIALSPNVLYFYGGAINGI